MTHRATITLDDEAHAFLKKEGGDNRSGYINHLLKEEKQRTLQQAILQANQEEAGDPDYQEDLAEWDATLGDGLNADV